MRSSYSMPAAMSSLIGRIFLIRFGRRILDRDLIAHMEIEGLELEHLGELLGTLEIDSERGGSNHHGFSVLNYDALDFAVLH